MKNAVGVRLGPGRPSWLDGWTAILAGLLLAITTPIWAQQIGGGIHTYPLRNSQVHEIEPSLVQLLPPGTEVKADARSNQFIVHGPSDVQRMAAEAIQNLDHPSNGRSGSIIAAKTIVRTYNCPAGQQKSQLADLLEREFGATQGFRTSPDPRSNQVLVIALPVVQSQVARRLGQGSGGSSLTPRPVVASISPARRAEAGSSQVIQLQNVSASQVEMLVNSNMKDYLTEVDRSAVDVTVYQLMGSDGAPVRMTVDRRTNQITVEGTGRGADSMLKFLRACDGPRPSSSSTTAVIPVDQANMDDVQKVVDAIPDATVQPPENTLLATQLMQREGQPQVGPSASVGAPAAFTNGQPFGPSLTGEQRELMRGIMGRVNITVIDDMGTLVITGDEADVQAVKELIAQIEQLSDETKPAIEVHPLGHVYCETLAELVSQVYAEVYAARQGTVSITALVKPNSLLIIGRQDAVDTVLDLVGRLDRPVLPNSQFRVFRLERANAVTTLEVLEGMYGDEQGALGVQVRFTADARTNSVIVQASPRDLDEIAEVIQNLDASHVVAMKGARVIKLHNALADDLADVLQDALGGDSQQGDETSMGIRLDLVGTAAIESGILSDVRIVAEPRSNSLLVYAPEDAMPLIEALIRELDQLPDIVAEIKVFGIENSDATALTEMLETLLQSSGQSNEPAMRTGALEGDSSLVAVRLSTDVRSNSIIAMGSVGDLEVVEALLMRLDEDDERERKVEVYVLNNVFAEDVADAINEHLNNERDVQSIESELLSSVEQLEREVSIVPVLASNSLIISATPRYFDEVMSLIEKLDERESMVMIQVVIAEVELNNTDEFGVELGLQDSLLFDRSLLTILDTTTETVFDSVTGLPVSSNETIQSATISPGFDFANNPLGNTGSSGSLATAGTVAGQAVSNFSVGRLNSELGYGGLILSASSEAVSVLIRALQEKRRMDILSRPQIMALNNQPAFILVGERVPTIRGVTNNESGGQTNQIEMEDAGISLEVVPRISPDGLVVMEIHAVKSEVGPESDGIAIAISQGQTIRAPKIKTTEAETVVAALDGQTVVLGGLITDTSSSITRRVPLLSDIPILGNLFRYDGTICKKTELLIILTPRIVENEGDAALIKQVEADRMHWCLADVVDLTGDETLRRRDGHWSDEETTVIYGEPVPETELMMQDMVPTRAPESPRMRAPEAPPRQLRPEPMPQDDRTSNRRLPEMNAAARYTQRPSSAVRPATYDAGPYEQPMYGPVRRAEGQYIDEQYNAPRVDTMRRNPAPYDARYDERRFPAEDEYLARRPQQRVDRSVVPAYEPAPPLYQAAPQQQGHGYVDPGQYQNEPSPATRRY